MGQVLEKELRTFESHREGLKARAMGKFALVSGGELVDVFETENDAIAQGYKRYGNVPFLVKQIVEVDAPLDFTAKLLVK